MIPETTITAVDSVTAVVKPTLIDHAVHPYHPFHRAAGGRPFPSVAYYAEKRVILSEHTTTVTYQLKEVTANLSGPRSSTHFYAPRMAKDYASTTMSTVPVDGLSQNVNVLTYVPSVVRRITMPSHGHVGLDHTPPTDFFLSMTSPSLLH
jgi:hypothetical protein